MRRRRPSEAQQLLGWADSGGREIATVGIRPEDIGVAEGSARGGEHRFSALVRVAEFRGASAILNLRTDEGPEIRALTAGRGATPLDEGSTVDLVVRRDELHLFAEDGRRLSAGR